MGLLGTLRLDEAKTYTTMVIEPTFQLLSAAIKRAINGDQTDLCNRLVELKKQLSVLESMVRRLNGKGKEVVKRKEGGEKKKVASFIPRSFSNDIQSSSGEDLGGKSFQGEIQVIESTPESAPVSRKKSLNKSSNKSTQTRLTNSQRREKASSNNISPSFKSSITTHSALKKSRSKQNSKFLLGSPSARKNIRLPDTLPDSTKWLCPRSSCGNYTPEFFHYCNFCGYPRDRQFLYNSTIERLDKRALWTATDDRLALLIISGNLSGIQWMIKKGWPINYRVQDSTGICYDASDLADKYGQTEIREFFYSLEKTGPPRQKNHINF